MEDVIWKDISIYLYLFAAYCFLRDIHKGNLSIQGADNKQSTFANEWKNFGKDKKNTW